MNSIDFTIDEQTPFHRPYIGITIYWLGEDFELHQALLTIEEFQYPHTELNIYERQ